MDNPDTVASLEVLTLGLWNEIFAIDAHSVREILDLVPVTEVPNARPFVGGLVNVRGKVVPLADLRVPFGMERPPSTPDTRIIVVELTIAGEPTTVGLLADRVHEVAGIELSAVEDTPSIGMRWPPEFVRKIAKYGGDFIIIPDLERIFS